MNANRDSIYVVFWMNSQRDPRNAMSHHPYKNQKKEKERKKEMQARSNTLPIDQFISKA